MDCGVVHRDVGLDLARACDVTCSHFGATVLY